MAGMASTRVLPMREVDSKAIEAIRCSAESLRKSLCCLPCRCPEPHGRRRRPPRLGHCHEAKLYLDPRWNLSDEAKSLSIVLSGEGMLQECKFAVSGLRLQSGSGSPLPTGNRLCQKRYGKVKGRCLDVGPSAEGLNILTIGAAAVLNRKPVNELSEATLRQLLQTVELTVDAKRMIGLLLCRAALHLVGSRWASSPMTLDTVSVFYQLDDAGKPVFFLDKLFLSVEPRKLTVQPERSGDILASSLDEVRALGIVLAQIELGEKQEQIVPCEQEHMQSPQDMELPVDHSKLVERLRMANDDQDSGPLASCIDFCLNRKHKGGQDVFVGQEFDCWFYEGVIEPLERDLVEKGWTWEQVNWTEPRILKANGVHRLLKETRLPCRDGMELNGQRVRKLPKKLLRYLKKHQSAEVKIGLEDTGIDLTHPMFEKHLDSGRISVGGCKDFTGDNMKPDGAMTDKVGHGTHLAYAILEATAPQCRLYIARVYKQNTPEPDTEEYVAQATRWLVKECGVEVLIMAFTFNKFSVLISQAIAEAEHVWFGAAAHHHSKKPVLGRYGNMKDTCTDKDTYAFGYPASDPKVSAIYSVDKEGKRSNFSPPGRRCCRNLAIQGEDVEAAWPLALNQGDVGMEGSNCMSNTKLMSGTSQATALVGAHVANVLLMLKTTPFENPRTTSFLEPGKHKDLIVWALTTEAGTESVMDSSHPTPTVTDDYSVIRPRLFLGKPLAECRSRVEKVIEGFYAGRIF